MFKEIETKYKAQDLKLQQFKNFAESLSPISQIHTGSYDHYFLKSDNEFLRYRAGAKPELTIKTKINDKDNFVRVEINLPLSPDTPESEAMKIVTAFCEALGFKHNFTIYKIYSVYFYETHNLVYYTVYDSELVEKERFIEIEMDERRKWTSESEAWAALELIEKQCAPLGIGYKNRLRKSLFEIFRKV